MKHFLVWSTLFLSTSCASMANGFLDGMGVPRSAAAATADSTESIAPAADPVAAGSTLSTTSDSRGAPQNSVDPQTVLTSKERQLLLTLSSIKSQRRIEAISAKDIKGLPAMATTCNEIGSRLDALGVDRDEAYFDFRADLCDVTEILNQRRASDAEFHAHRISGDKARIVRERGGFIDPASREFLSMREMGQRNKLCEAPGEIATDEGTQYLLRCYRFRGNRLTAKKQVTLDDPPRQRDFAQL